MVDLSSSLWDSLPVDNISIAMLTNQRVHPHLNGTPPN